MNMLKILDEWFAEKGGQTYEEWIVYIKTESEESRIIGFFCVEDFSPFY